MSDSTPPAGPSSPLKELSGRIGKYEITRPLGKGAMGMVYLAYDTVLERDVALKVMVAQIADDPELKQRFEREAKAVAKMTHPNVVTVFDLGYHVDGSPYIAMELLKGSDLQKAMRQTPPMALDKKVGVIVQTLAGLAHAHQAGIVHRDIKPANIFINSDGSVKIMDFGVARLTTASMTGTGNIVGTADYMSPEQVKGARVDGRSDIFSVGCMLYELVVGRRPFHADNLMAIFYKITHEEPGWENISGGPEYDALLPILQKALSKNLEERYQSAYDFAVDLRDYLKVHASPGLAQRVADNLADLQAPTHPGQGAVTEPGPTVVSGGDIGTGAGRGTRPGVPTVRGAAPTVIGGPGTTPPTVLSPTPGRPAPPRPQTSRPVVPSTPVRPAPSSAVGPLVLGLAGLLGVGILGVGGYVAVTQWGPGAATPAPTPEAPVTPVPTADVTAAPTPAVTDAPTVSTPPPTAATPPPTAAIPSGSKAAASVRAAQAAFSKGDYERAVTQAQQALREDPQELEAKRILENATAGQRAASFFSSAEAALDRKDYTQAAADVEKARDLAPWDNRGPDLLRRIQRARDQDNITRTKEKVAGLLRQADDAVAARNYETAITLYNEVLGIDSDNQRALIGRQTAVTGREGSRAGNTGGGAPVAPGRRFIQGETLATSAETKAGGGTVPDGFEDSKDVVVKKGSQAAELPGRIRFEVDPEVVKAGQKYTVRVLFINQGLAPIQVTTLVVTTTVNGRKSSGPVPPLVKDVAPQQRAALLSLPDFWKEDINTWSMEVVVTTARGETYRNTLTWQ